MFDSATLTQTLSLHDRAYGVLLWLNDALRAKKLPFTSLELVLTSKDAAAAWMRANHANLPANLRPAPEELEAFAFHFVSFINTSFEVVGSMTLPNCPGCTCCGFYKIGQKHLKVRSLGKKAKEKAEDLKKLYLQKLAEEKGEPLSPADAESFIAGHPELEDAVTLATYAQELVRRGNFTSQGESVLSLWRDLSEDIRKAPRRWNKKRKKFKVTVPDVLEAEKQILATL